MNGPSWQGVPEPLRPFAERAVGAAKFLLSRSVILRCDCVAVWVSEADDGGPVAKLVELGAALDNVRGAAPVLASARAAIERRAARGRVPVFVVPRVQGLILYWLTDPTVCNAKGGDA